MRYMGLDLGTRTLGISLSDESKMIASSHSVIRFEEEDYESLVEKIKQLMEENNVEKIVLGFPKNMNNTIGPKGELSLWFQELLTKQLSIEVDLQDERRTTIEATNYMIAAGASRDKRKKKIDALAACIILQTYLDKERG